MRGYFWERLSKRRICAIDAVDLLGATKAFDMTAIVLSRDG